MSTDLYVALPAASWPTMQAVQQCMVRQAYPVEVKRFPTFSQQRVVSDGALVTVDGADAYLEGDLSSAALGHEEVNSINKRLAATADSFRVQPGDAVMSVRVRSVGEMRAASYVLAGLIVCFHGYGFELQGNGHGREEFAKALVAGAAMLGATMK